MHDADLATLVVRLQREEFDQLADLVHRDGLLVFFHGGGFTFCDTGTHDALCRRLAHGAGVPILSVDYRLAPEHAWPAHRDDADHRPVALRRADVAQALAAAALLAIAHVAGVPRRLLSGG